MWEAAGGLFIEDAGSPQRVRASPSGGGCDRALGPLPPGLGAQGTRAVPVESREAARRRAQLSLPEDVRVREDHQAVTGQVSGLEAPLSSLRCTVALAFRSLLSPTDHRQGMVRRFILQTLVLNREVSRARQSIARHVSAPAVPASWRLLRPCQDSLKHGATRCGGPHLQSQHLGRQRQENLQVGGQPGLHYETLVSKTRGKKGHKPSK